MIDVFIEIGAYIVFILMILALIVSFIIIILASYFVIKKIIEDS